jgi:hypothetical protein
VEWNGRTSASETLLEANDESEDGWPRGCRLVAVILNCWHEHKLSYHILSILARDLISVPVSTISSESAFSLCGRIIEERRRRLAPEMVEMLLCMKDWELGEARGQHSTQDEDLEEAFEGLYLDDP